VVFPGGSGPRSFPASARGQLPSSRTKGKDQETTAATYHGQGHSKEVLTGFKTSRAEGGRTRRNRSEGDVKHDMREKSPGGNRTCLSPGKGSLTHRKLPGVQREEENWNISSVTHKNCYEKKGDYFTWKRRGSFAATPSNFKEKFTKEGVFIPLPFLREGRWPIVESSNTYSATHKKRKRRILPEKVASLSKKKKRQRLPGSREKVGSTGKFLFEKIGREKGYSDRENMDVTFSVKKGNRDSNQKKKGVHPLRKKNRKMVSRK